MLNLYCLSFNFNNRMILICKNKQQFDIHIYIYYRISFYFGVTYKILLLHGNAPTHKEVMCIILCLIECGLENYSVLPHQTCFGSSWSSDSTVLKSSIFESK